MLNKTDLKLISLTRFKEAQILYNREKYEGVVHLCLCALEIALKKKIWSVWGAGFPETTHEFYMFEKVKTHNLQKLLKLSRLESNMKKNTELWADWSIMQGLNTEIRYSRIGTIEHEEANRIKKATNNLLKFLKIK